MWMLLAAAAWPCGVAKHYRLLPLGVVGEDVVALELPAHRSDGDDYAVLWSGQASLVRVGAWNTERIQGLGEVRWTREGYEQGLRTLLRRADKAARLIAEFEAAVLETHQVRGFDSACFGVPSLQHTDLVYADASRWGEDERNAGALGRPIGAVRHYSTAESAFYVVTVGVGSHMPTVERRVAAAMQSPADYAWRSEIPHHGWVVDVVLPVLPDPAFGECLPDAHSN